MPNEIFFPLQLLQLEEATPSTAPHRDHHRGGPLRLLGGRKDALRESQKRNTERFNGKRMLHVMKETPFHTSISVEELSCCIWFPEIPKRCFNSVKNIKTSIGSLQPGWNIKRAVI
ncbi:hypothetical protein TNCV_136821 [Trichonephila clavipes]|nr:hypothetical protein TNCV_136821 [Trichonephila clavipes]